ncbi:hypothetical protein EDC04DRAFT_2550956, partial [Pisolithus marmoratus]
FKQLGEIEWHTLAPSKLRVFESDGGLGDLSGGGTNSKDFIPAKGGLCRSRVFKGSDGHNYHWELGLLKCTLYRANGAPNPIPIAKYHRRRNFWFPFVKSRDGGYLDINATVRAYRQHFGSRVAYRMRYREYDFHKGCRFSGSGEPSRLDGDMLDLLVFTYIYVEKLRKERE